jgi:hypothetical protein
VTISLNLSDRVVDLAGEGFDCAVRVGDLPDSSLVSVRLADNRRLCVATPGVPASGTARRSIRTTWCKFDCLTLSSDASQTRGWAFRVLPRKGEQGEEAGLPHFKPAGPLDCSDGQVLHDWCVQGWASPGAAPGRWSRRSPTAGWSKCWPKFAAPPNGIYAVFPAAQAPAAAGAAVDRLPQAPLRPAAVLDGRDPQMILESLLAYAHILAILTLVVFIASEAALCRPEWMNATKSSSGW